MTGPILALIIVSPLAGIIGVYRLFNNGNMPCIDSDVDNKNKIIPDETN